MNHYSEESEFPEESYFTSENTDQVDFIDPPKQTFNINIELTIQPQNLLKTFTNIQITEKQLQNLNVNDLLTLIQQEENICFDNATIYAFLPVFDMYAKLGEFPLSNNTILNTNNLFVKDNVITVMLKVKFPYQNDEVSFATTTGLGNANTEDSLELSEDTDKRRHRHKERMIGEAIELVHLWRKFYNGYINPQTGELVKLGLEEGARKLGVAKKSLDDYLLMIKHAKNLDFDFQRHHGDRFGILRAFVKEAKDKKKKNAKYEDNDDEEEYNTKKIKKVTKKKVSKTN